MTMTAESLRILFYDLETAPSAAFIWHPTDQYVPMDRLIHGSFQFTWAAKWLDEKTMFSGVVTGDEARARDDSRIVTELAELVRQADILVAHNADRFDVPMLNNRLLILGQEPMGPVKTIDTLKLAKKNLRLPYNKLDYLGEVLGLGRKIKTDFDLWRDCYEGDEKALAKMSRYNKQDVVLLELVYKRLLPYSSKIGSLPRLVEPTEVKQFGCPTCGSVNVEKRGVHRTNVSTFQQYHCLDCGRYSRSRLADKPTFSLAPL